LFAACRAPPRPPRSTWHKHTNRNPRAAPNYVTTSREQAGAARVGGGAPDARRRRRNPIRLECHYERPALREMTSISGRRARPIGPPVAVPEPQAAGRLSRDCHKRSLSAGGADGGGGLSRPPIEARLGAAAGRDCGSREGACLLANVRAASLCPGGGRAWRAAGRQRAMAAAAEAHKARPAGRVSVLSQQYWRRPRPAGRATSGWQCQPGTRAGRARGFVWAGGWWRRERANKPTSAQCVQRQRRAAGSWWSRCELCSLNVSPSRRQRGHRHNNELSSDSNNSVKDTDCHRSISAFQFQVSQKSFLIDIYKNPRRAEPGSCVCAALIVI
jgi:hypothetical protein